MRLAPSGQAVRPARYVARCCAHTSRSARSAASPIPRAKAWCLTLDAGISAHRRPRARRTSLRPLVAYCDSLYRLGH